jgi:hypothetical protein
MKKILFVIAIACSASFVQAQTQFGLKGGVNLSTITGDNSSIFSSSVAAYAGGLVNITIDKQFSLQPEAILSFEGAKFSSGGVTGRISGTFVNVPFLAQYRAGSGFILQSGPQLGLLLSASQKITGMGSEDFKDNLKSTNFSWAFGAGYIPKASQVGFNVRYNLGISNINSTPGPANRISTWQIGTFIMLK